MFPAWTTVRWYGGLRKSSSGRAKVSHLGKTLISRVVEVDVSCGIGLSAIAGLPVEVSIDTSAQSSGGAGRCTCGEAGAGSLKQSKS